MTVLYVCIAYLSSRFFKKTRLASNFLQWPLKLLSMGLVVRLAPATSQAPGAGEVPAQHAAALPAPRLVVRNRHSIRGSIIGMLDLISAGFRFIRVLAPVPARRDGGSFAFQPVSTQRAAPVGTIAGHEKHGLAAALGNVGDGHEKNLSPSSRTA